MLMMLTCSGMVGELILTMLTMLTCLAMVCRVAAS